MKPKRTLGQVVSAIAGFCMLSVSVPLVLAMIHDLVFGGDNLVGALVAGTFMGFVALAGAFLFWRGVRKPDVVPLGGHSQSDSSVFDPERGLVNEKLERRVLQLARDRDGRLTATELALEIELNVPESKLLLEYLVHHEAARTFISDDGDIVYSFPGLMVDKAAAFDPLDDEVMFDRELAAAQDDEEVSLAQPAAVNKEEW